MEYDGTIIMSILKKQFVLYCHYILERFDCNHFAFE